MTSAQTIAEYVLWTAHESGSFISNLKLQKLLYYIQAWHLSVFRRPLFPEKFQAWPHGPAIPEIYRRYKHYGWRNIDEAVDCPSLEPTVTRFIEEVLDEYGPLDARRLESLTHREDPWIEARNGLEDAEPCSNEISEGTMEQYYRQRLVDSEIEAMLAEMQQPEAQIIHQGNDGGGT
jgi:uncharacterized phage-associated protein